MEKVNNLDFNRSWGQLMVSRQDLGFGLKPEDDIFQSIPLAISLYPR